MTSNRVQKSTRAQCTPCNLVFETHVHPGLQLLAAGAGVALGAVFLRKLFAGLLLGGIFYAASRLADHHQALTCPGCGRQAEWTLVERPEAAPGKIFFEHQHVA